MADTRDDRRHEPSGLMATDAFSLRLHDLIHNPGAVRTTSTINLVDDYRHSSTWVIDTFRVEGGAETVFLQFIDADAPLRVVLPPAVTAVLAQQRERATTKNRKRGAQKALATRIARGDTLGNPDALRKARKAKRTRKG